MGKDFWYYIDPPESKVYGEDGYIPRQRYNLCFWVSKSNDVLGYIDPHIAWSKKELIDEITELGNKLPFLGLENTIEAKNELDDTLEAIKVYSTLIGEMGEINTIWIHYL